MAFRAFLSAFKTAFVGFSLLMLFQNCAGGGHLQLQDNPGNGGGYEGLSTGDPVNGMPAIVTYLYEGSCSGGEIESAISTSGGAYLLTIEACQVLSPPRAIDPSEITRPSLRTLQYQNRIYEVR